MFVNCAQDDAEAISAFIGPQEEVIWEKQDVPMVTKHVLVTQSKMNGKTLAELHFSSVYGVNVTRVKRGGTLSSSITLLLWCFLKYRQRAKRSSPEASAMSSSVSGSPQWLSRNSQTVDIILSLLFIIAEKS